jgi:hypothetical protein
VVDVRAQLERGATIVGAATDAASTAFVHADELVNQFRKAHPALAAEVEVVLEEFIARFRPRPEEELLSTLHTLLQRCYQSVMMPLEDPMPASLRDTLSRLARKFFTPSIAKAQQQQQQGVGAGAAAKGQPKQPLPEALKAAYERDFRLGAAGAGEPISLQEAMCRLRKWRQVRAGCVDVILECRVTCRAPDPSSRPICNRSCCTASSRTLS